MYLDTSVLVAYYCPEPISDQVEALVQSQRAPTLSELTEVEFHSAVARKVREGGLSRPDALRILAEFATHVDGDWYTRLSFESQHYRLAKDWLGQLQWPIRTLDALHLATAAGIPTVLVTADIDLARVAGSLGIERVLVTPKRGRSQH